MKNIFAALNPSSFEDNRKRLQTVLQGPFEQVRTKVALLSNKKSDVLRIAGPGSFISLGLLQHLSEGQRRFVIDERKKAIAKAFYGELWNQPGHPTIEFIRKNADVEVVLEVVHQGKDFSQRLDLLWVAREKLSKHPGAEASVHMALTLLDNGAYRVAEPDASAENGWKVNGWLKQAILLSFRLYPNQIMDEPTFGYDKIQPKWAGWDEKRFREAGFRVVPGAIVRHGAYIGKNVILMPSFVNIGAFVGEGTMVDTWATVGSCAQIGKKCHISGGAGIGGVLEPLQANPVIIEDECFIGARSEVVEGVIVKRRAVLSMGVFIGKNTPIVDRTKDNAISYGVVPEGAVVMMGAHPSNGLICPQIVKYRDEKTDAATALNSILRG